MSYCKKCGLETDTIKEEFRYFDECTGQAIWAIRRRCVDKKHWWDSHSDDSWLVRYGISEHGEE